MHAFSAEYNHVIASGWCSTVGMVGFYLGGGHGPFAPTMGLGVDNVLEIEVIQVGQDENDEPSVHKKVAGTIPSSSGPYEAAVEGSGRFNFEYFYAHAEPDYRLFRDRLKAVLEPTTVLERNFNSVFEYVLSMPADKFLLAVNNPLAAPQQPSDAATGSQNSVIVSRDAMKTKFAATRMEVLDICVASLLNPDPTSPDPAGYRCGFHFLYTSLTGNLGSPRPDDTAISPGFRSAVMMWNARTLSTQQSVDILYGIGQNSYFSESSYVMHNWTSRYWGQALYDQLLTIKKAHDPGDHFWCHHYVADNPHDIYGDPLSAAANLASILIKSAACFCNCLMFPI
ncbi:hypothetical protein LTR43_006401 [Exophiala xenobiotica]|nr:hypothetical protein LTR55_009908 [Exophiala xenobiotica]